MSEPIIPKYIFFTKGVGRHKDKLWSFELGLRDAGIAPFNLVKVSSIMPPGCEIIAREEGLKMIKPGQILHCVAIRNSTNKEGELISSAVGLAAPEDTTKYGYLSEHSAIGKTEEETSKYAEEHAASMLAASKGTDFDPEKAWDKKKQIYEMDGKPVKTHSMAQSAKGKKDIWTTIGVAAIMI